jgi:Leucine-rich repeat (LRR) protein
MLRYLRWLSFGLISLVTNCGTDENTHPSPVNQDAATSWTVLTHPSAVQITDRASAPNQALLTFTCPAGPTQPQCEALVRLSLLRTGGTIDPTWFTCPNYCLWNKINCDGGNIVWLVVDFQTKTLPTGAFDGLSYLQGLIFAAGSEVETIQSEVFRDLHALTYFELSSTKLSSIATDAFQGLTGLTELELKSGQITSLQANSFRGLDNVTLLSLFANKLTSISKDAFQGLPQLEHLDLGGNHGLATLDLGTFDNLPRLRNINLAGGKFSNLPVGIFGKLGSLENLTLHSNSLLYLAPGLFSGVDNLRHLTLYNNFSLSGTPITRDLCYLWSRGLVIDDRGNPLNRYCGVKSPDGF